MDTLIAPAASPIIRFMRELRFSLTIACTAASSWDMVLVVSAPRNLLYRVGSRDGFMLKPPSPALVRSCGI